MRFHKIGLPILVWAASLVGVAAWASQATTRGEQPPTMPMGQPYGEILTGADLGFQRIAAPPDRDGRVAGRLMVRVNGQWREAVAAPRVVR